MIFTVIALALLGFCIALYTYATEIKVRQNPDFKPVCDISDRISCSKPMKSTYGNVFFFSNSIVAILFYALIIALELVNATNFVFIAALIGCVASCFLGYLLYFKIKSLCLLCTSLYIINFLILYFSIRTM